MAGGSGLIYRGNVVFLVRGHVALLQLLFTFSPNRSDRLPHARRSPLLTSLFLFILPSLPLPSKADLRRKETSMVCCSANWGAGGYLSVRPNNNNSNNTSPETASAAEAAAAASFAELSLVDATLINKPRAAVFRVVDCDDYTPQPFVGGRLMPNPRPPSGGGGAGERPPGTAGGTGWGKS